MAAKPGYLPERLKSLLLARRKPFEVPQCGLTPRPSGAPTADHQARAAPGYMLHRAGRASYRRRLLRSNVRPHMRRILATVAGVLVTGFALHFIRGAAAAFGVVPEVPLPYPVEHSYGRYASELVESSDTLFGMASFFAAAYLGLTVGYIVYRMSLQPWRTTYERATATAWAAFLGFTVLYSAAVQLAFDVRADRSWLQTAFIDLITHAAPAIVGWLLWRWWKRATRGTTPE